MVQRRVVTLDRLTAPPADPSTHASYVWHAACTKPNYLHGAVLDAYPRLVQFLPIDEAARHPTIARNTFLTISHPRDPIDSDKERFARIIFCQIAVGAFQIIAANQRSSPPSKITPKEVAEAALLRLKRHTDADNLLKKSPAFPPKRSAPFQAPCKIGA